AFFFPGVAVVVVAERLPEAAPVVLHEAQAAHPLGALPEIEVGDEHAGGAAMFGRERSALVGVDDVGLAVDDVGEGQVSGVAAIGVCQYVAGAAVKLDVLEEGVYAYAFPVRVELGPLGDAVDVGGEGLPWK